MTTAELVDPVSAVESPQLGRAPDRFVIKLERADKRHKMCSHINYLKCRNVNLIFKNILIFCAYSLNIFYVHFNYKLHDFQKTVIAILNIPLD